MTWKVQRVLVFVFVVYFGCFARAEKGFVSSILQGFTDAASAEFSIMYYSGKPVSMMAKNIGTGELYKPQWSKSHSFKGTKFDIHKVYFNGLVLGQKYELLLLDAKSQVIDRRNFSLLDLNRKSTKFAVASCLDDFRHTKDIWKSLLNQKADMLFLIGDTVYADHIEGGEILPADPEQLWNRYSDSRKKLYLYQSKNLLPVFVIWDDHDFGDNNSGKWYPHREEAKRIFNVFFAQQGFSSHFEKGPSIGFQFKGFHQKFLFTDGRYYRGRHSEEGATHFGEVQKKWIFDSLSSNAQQPTWLIKGDQWFGPYSAAESFMRAHPEDFDSFMKGLKKIGGKYLFLSGDIHFSEIMGIEEDFFGYSTFEITSSPLHSFTFPGWHNTQKNTRRIEATSKKNFVLLEVTIEGNGLSGKVQSLDKNGEEIFSLPINL